MRRVFVIAMDVEAAAIIDRLEDARSFTVQGRRIVEGKFAHEESAVIISGIGKVNAAAATSLAIARYNPELIVNVGVAGAIDAKMAIGELYSVNRTFQCDFDLSEINKTSKGTLDEYDSPWFELEVIGTLPTAICATGDAFDNTDSDCAFVREEMGASLRDMELGAIAQVGKRAGVKVAAVKTVSDVHSSGKPKPTEQYAGNLFRAVESIRQYDFPA